ncbi:MAG TPA: hypothetical protein VFL70_00200, partial [Bacteroidia bacterium]|nr:hypothetical protein [Bacteroidia bacterium]
SNELNKYKIKQEAFIKAEQYYQNLIMLYDYNGKCDKKKVNTFLIAIIAEVGKDYEQTQSPIISYYLKIFEMDHYQLHENHVKAKDTCLELLDIVRYNKSVYRKERVGIVYDHLSRCEYYLENYKQAAEWAKEAHKYFNRGSDNYCVALEQEFYALLAMEDYDKAKEAADKMRTGAAKEELGAFRHAKYNFLFANALFKGGRYKEVITLLSQGLEISKDKAGWEIGIRVLGIMACLELERFNEAAFSIERLRKFIAFTEKKTPVSVRDKTIGSLLQALEKQAFAFTSLSAKAGKYLELLSSKEKEYCWEPFTHEVIPFHEWLKSKCKISKMEPKGTAPFMKELIKE